VRDEPMTYNIAGSGAWSPSNYNKEFLGDVTFVRALAESLNIPAIKVSEYVGRDLVRKIATDFGIANELAAGPALALGASESTLIEMTGAYAGILNGGSSVLPYGLKAIRLQGDAEPLAGRAGGIGERVMDAKAAQALTYMMYEVIENGTGQRARIEGIEAAGKTGTTQAARDAWFIGFTSDFVVGVWMGYDDNTPLKGVTGGGIPADIWRKTMIAITSQSAPGPLPMLRGPSKSSMLMPSIDSSQETEAGTTIFDTLLGILTGKN